MTTKKAKVSRKSNSPEKWYRPKFHSGFRKTYSVKKNVDTIMKNADGDYLLAIRSITALANVTKDMATKRKARAVVKVLSEGYKMSKEYVIKKATLYQLAHKLKVKKPIVI